MNDDVDTAEALLNEGNSPFHKVCYQESELRLSLGLFLLNGDSKIPL